MEFFKETNPNPKCELNYTNAYTLAIAVLLSAQSTDKGVNKATAELFKIADTPQKMLSLGDENLKKYIKTIGLYNTKANNIMRMAKILCEQYNGQLPLNMDKLQQLPGIGRKTANVILNVWVDLPTIAVDTHVFRVAHRLGLSDGKTPFEVEQDLAKIIPVEYHKNLNHWFVLFGRYHCKAKNPLCSDCKLKPFCKEKQN